MSAKHLGTLATGDRNSLTSVLSAECREARIPIVLVLAICWLATELWAEEPLTLWYRQPAAKWTEALPVGNGRLGAMVFGGTTNERIQMNEITIWAGPPYPEPKPGGPTVLERARQLEFEGKYSDAESLVQKELLPPAIEPRSYQPLGDLQLKFDLPGEVRNYRRQLDLDTSVATTTFEMNGITFRREVFVSRPDDAIVINLSANQPGRVSCLVSLSRPDAETTVAAPNTLILRGQASHDAEHKGVKFEAQICAHAEGGTVTVVGNLLNVQHANAVTLVLGAATDYNYKDPSHPLAVPLGLACERVSKLARQKYGDLRETSVRAYQVLFRRVSLDLGPTLMQATDERLAAIRGGSADPGLAALYFQFGRYLLISSSRPGGLPANLQGLWNEEMKAPWNSDYHININLQMNYWPAEVANLGECHEPLFDYIEGLLPAGQRTAQQVFGCRGFCACLNSDPWRWTVPYGSPRWGMWVMGGAWCTQDFMEHYRFTGDREFLRKRAYPILKEASLFLLDWLVPEPQTGKLVSGPTTSPENAFIAPDGKEVSLSMGCSMDQEIVWDVFNNTLEAARALTIQDDFTARVKNALEKLLLPKVGSDGRLLEWHQEFPEPEPGHRHMSHLFAVHPGHQFTWQNASGMMNAAQKSIEFRLAHGGGHTGWSRAWIINFWARFRNGEKAHENLVALLAHSTLPDLFDTHPPFQIDGNFGATAGIAEMLLQSHQTITESRSAGEPSALHIIELLPALPKAWASGSVRGLRARGGFEVDIVWTNGQLETATLHSILGNTCVLHYGERTIQLGMPPGRVLRFDHNLRNF